MTEETPFDVVAAKAELTELNKEAMDLLRQAQTLQAELTAIKDIPGKTEVRSAIVGRASSLHRQRHTIKQRAKDIERQMHDAEKARTLTYVAGSSPTAAIREVADRVGTLEHLYINLCRALDSESGYDGTPFDWQRLVTTARRNLGNIT